MVSAVVKASPRWPVLALSALAALAPFNIDPTVSTWTDLQLRPLVIFALLVSLTLVVRSLRVRPLRLSWIDGIASFWLFAVWLAVVVGDSLMIGAAGAARISVVILLVLAIRNVVRTRDDVVVVLQSLAVGSVVGAGLGLLVWLVDADAVSRVFVGNVTKLGPFDRLTHPWAHANSAAMALGATAASIVLLPNRWLRGAGLAVVTLALVATISRGGLLGATAAALVWVVIQRDRRSSGIVVALGVLAAVAVVFSAGWTTRTDQLGDQAFYNVDIGAPGVFTLEDNERLVDITIVNQSTVVWSRSGPDQVLISARWIGPDGLVWTEDRWSLPDDLGPGETQQTGLTVTTRLPVGTYEVRWDLMLDGVAYFDQFLGESPVVTSAEITASTVSLDQVTRYRYVDRLVPDDRVETWRLAWQDFRSSPLVGVGPNQFADDAVDELRSQGRLASSHAHNIVLEPLATWGLLGAVPFFVLGAAGLWRSVVLAWKTRSTSATVVAAGLAAVVTHGMVDWPLVVITTGIPVGIVVGLALAETDDATSSHVTRGQTPRDAGSGPT